VKFNLFFILIFLTFFFKSEAQYFYYPYNTLEEKKSEENTYTNPNEHTSVKPYMLNFTQWKTLDSINPKAMGKDTSVEIYIKPVINALFNQHFQQYHDDGFSFYAAFGKKISVNFNASEFFINPTHEQKSIADSTGMLNHVGKINTRNQYWNKTFMTGAVYWQTLPYLSFEAGMGKHFLGDGYRSLFLSENASPYPYLKGTVKIWKIEYLILYSFLNEPTWGSFNQSYKRKNSTLHYLSWNINKRLNINAFETVIWQIHDSIGNRGMDVNYLNPIIFFRPVEYSLGSPDNVIMGAGFRYRIFKNTHIYGQLLIDEFKLSEIKAQTGWWGNKFGGQYGIKTYNFFKIPHLFGLLECNVIRPFAYSHSNYLSNWGNMHEPLAHPLGANFIEWIAQSAYSYKRWTITGEVFYQQTGRGDGNFNAGDNIYRSYEDRRTDYGNFLLVGNKSNEYSASAGIYYLLNKQWHLKAFTGCTYRLQKDEIFGKSHDVYINFGLVTNKE
jgi:hypothetical protein